VADEQVDILIIGGGLTGATLMIALASAGFTTRLVEVMPFLARTRHDFDARTIALAPASVRILQMLKVWPLLEKYATIIDTIHVSEQKRFGHACLQREKNSPLGYVVEMQHIHSALHQLLPHQHILAPAQLTALNSSNGKATIRTETGETTLQARLIVAADGADSCVRQLCGLTAVRKDYNQQALVANIGLARHHQQVAYERFMLSGPLALLPMSGQRASLIWSLPPLQAARLMAMPEHEFLNTLQREFGYRLGRFVKVGQRAVYPLRQVIMPQLVAWPVVFVGNAAHTLHPVAAQGFNLGLRDVALLAQCIVQNGINEAMLHQYQANRCHDQAAISRLTDGLITLFSSQLPGLSVARGAGLAVFDNISWLNKPLTRYTKGFAGMAPDLVCGIPLHSQERE